MREPILVTRSSMPPLEEYLDEIKSIWDNRWLTNMGEKHQRLEKELKEYLDVENISLFTNGHLSLELTLQGMNLTGEVITTPFTFVSTTHAIVRNGLTPVFCDIDYENYTMDASKIESLITDNTSAIVPVHVYGNICNLDEIERIAKKHNLKVIYDAAHAFGSKVNGNGIGNYGDASMFSFHATKVFNSIEGGAVAFPGNTFGDTLYKLKNFGIKSEDVIDGIGSNAKMNEFQAAMGLCNIRHVDQEINKRKKVVDFYRSKLRNVEGIKIIENQPNISSNYAYFPVVFDESVLGYTRDYVYERLKKENIFSRKYFYPLTNNIEAYKGRYDVKETPVAEYVANRVLTLPLYADLSIEDVNEICNIILSL